MIAIESSDDLKKYILIKLGNEFQKVELSAIQLELLIGEGVKRLQENSSLGQFKSYLKISKDTSGVTVNPDGHGNVYTLPKGIFAIANVYIDSQIVSTDIYQQYQKNQFVLNGFLYDFVSHWMFKNNMGILDKLSNNKIDYSYNRITNELQVSGSRSNIMLAECWTSIDENGTGIYGFPWIRDYTVALAKIQWATNLMKWTRDFHGGAILNWEAILSEGKEERERLEEELDQKLGARGPRLLIA